MNNNSLIKSYAAIDVGSNAIRSTFAHLNGKNKELTFFHDRRYPVRLGEDVFQFKRISLEKMKDTFNALKKIKEDIDENDIKEIRLIGTSALRDAKNGWRVERAILKQLGIPLEIINGDEEAKLILKSVESVHPLKNKNVILFDIGGGSTEFSVLHKGQLVHTESLQLGTVRVLEHLTMGEFERNLLDFQMRIKKSLSKHHLIPSLFIGTGGNLRRMGKMRSFFFHRPTTKITFKELNEMILRTSALSFDDRMKKLKMAPDRVDVIIPAMMIAQHFMIASKAQELLLPKVGLKEGVIFNQLSLKPSKIHFSKS